MNSFPSVPRKWIIIIDDMDDSPASFPNLLKVVIERNTHGNVGVATICGVLIAKSLDFVDRQRQEIEGDGGVVAGFLIDLFDRKAQSAGVELAKAIQAEPDLSDIPIVIYTDKHAEINETNLSQQANIRKVLRRDLARPMAEFYRIVLDAFGL
ncbi:hypothetical protein [Prosthecobacter sp.]|uniref:hypothetical protein n=1 Tax=Prosthecobacter sp. TaxID=1965333 RepID=UPI001DB39B81|nr:hypothetical protein [Prosthecobacter sp.]MCB1279659.1 hypothetical protein [Prosthecobacter sp.]